MSHVVQHTLDTVGCGAGGFTSRPARIARDVVRGTGGGLVASIYGEPDKVLVDQVAFANATANRYLDFNDFGVSGHPSDMIPALLAMTEATGGTGADAATAIYIAYEIATRVAEAAPADGGWDQGVFCALGVAAGQAKILRLPREKIGHALSLAVVPNIPLRVTRFGELSEWKAAATGQAATAATFAVRLSAAGMSGPARPFEGKDGLLERVWPALDLPTPLIPVSPSAIERSSLKRHPACYWGQVPIDLVTAIRDRATLSNVMSIDVATCMTAWRSIGGGRGDVAEKWHPTTRETADHSMPYLMAAVFMDGHLSEEAFTSERLNDPELLSIIDRIRVAERQDLTERATRDSCPTELTLHLVDGSTLFATADLPHGHPANPLTDDEVWAKFQSLATHALPIEQAHELGSLLLRLPELATLDDIAALFRAFTPK